MSVVGPLPSRESPSRLPPTAKRILDAATTNELVRVLRSYQVNEELWAHAKPEAKFMHCLPAVRGEEMTDAIIDAFFSIVLDAAENRKHFQKALLLALIGIDEVPTDPELQPIARALRD
jgi:aspartate carbamoyltransferase catalytic subunit